MNPTRLPLDPIARAQAIQAATEDARWMVLVIVASAIVLLFLLLFLRQIVEAIQDVPAACHRWRVARALRADLRRKYFPSFQVPFQVHTGPAASRPQVHSTLHSTQTKASVTLDARDAVAQEGS